MASTWGGGNTWNGSGALAPPVAPAATAAYRDRQILRMMADLLSATGQWDSVVTTGLPEERGRGAEDARLACLELQRWDEEDQSNDYDAIPQDRTVRFLLHLLVRNEDPDIRDDEIDRLLAVAQDTLSGVSIGGATLPDWTRLEKGTWLPATAPERRMTVTGTFVYQVSHFDRHATT